MYRRALMRLSIGMCGGDGELHPRLLTESAQVTRYHQFTTRIRWQFSPTIWNRRSPGFGREGF